MLFAFNLHANTKHCVLDIAFQTLRLGHCASGTMQLLNDWADCADIKDREPVRATGTQDRNNVR